jgi:hypothetical protein
MLSIILLFSLASGTNDPNVFIEGEWLAMIANGNRTEKETWPASVTIAFHGNSATGIFEATAWKNGVPSNESLVPMEELFLGHFEIEFKGNLEGRVFSNYPTRHSMSDFRFVRVQDFLAAAIKLDNSDVLDIHLLNGSVEAIIHGKSRQSAHYTLIKVAEGSGNEIFGRKWKLWLWIGGILGFIQLFIWLMLRSYRRSLSEKLDAVRAEHVINLDEKDMPKKKQKKLHSD